MSEATAVGTIVDDKYVVLELIGRGGMSDVWLARDRRLGKLWAIKEIKPNEGGVRGAALRQTIVDEANLMKHLDHPSIPRVVDIVDTGSTLFVVMDYVDGRTLSALMRERGGPFSTEEVVGWGIQLCDVLGYLHALDPAIIYRDLKPSNIMLRDDGSLRLIDFGVSMVKVPGQANDGKVAGTPGYSAPEQLRAQGGSTAAPGLDPKTQIGPEADVYALGTTMYALLTGHVPRRVTREDGTVQTVFSMRPMREWDASLSEGLERIVGKATSPEPSARYASMRELRYDLEHYEELTQDWREVQRRKVRGLWRRAALSAVSAVAGVACLCASAMVRTSSYESLVFAASAASREADEGEPSDAERLCERAIAVDANRCEAYQQLIDTYEHDYRFSDEEERRWRQLSSHARNLEGDPAYAQLCFDVGTCYLSYYGIEREGGSVGNTAVASMDAASPWFARAIEAGEGDAGGRGGLGDEADLRSARVYATIAGFYDQVTRAGREGKSATAAYRAFWDSLEEVIASENELPASRKSAEGVRARLCQVAMETVASSTYLAGLARAGVTEREVRDLVDKVRTCLRDLSQFAESKEYREVYGPVFDEIRTSLGLVDKNVASTYRNPVLAFEDAGQVGRRAAASQAEEARSTDERPGEEKEAL